VLVEIDADAVAAEIDDIGRPGAIGVGQVDTTLVEGFRVVEPGGVVHRDLLPEAAIPDVGPVADFALANSHQVRQTVTGHVGEINGLGPVGEHEARPLFLVQGVRYVYSRPETFLGVGLVPG
jgi:hypothetical protein